MFNIKIKCIFGTLNNKLTIETKNFNFKLNFKLFDKIHKYNCVDQLFVFSLHSFLYIIYMEPLFKGKLGCKHDTLLLHLETQSSEKIRWNIEVNIRFITYFI